MWENPGNQYIYGLEGETGTLEGEKTEDTQEGAVNDMMGRGGLMKN